MGHHVVDAMLVQMMLELAVRDAYSAPIIVRVVQVPLAAMHEDETAVPRALVTMAEQLTVQSDLTIFQALLLSGTLKYFELRGICRSASKMREDKNAPAVVQARTRRASTIRDEARIYDRTTRRR